MKPVGQSRAQHRAQRRAHWDKISARLEADPEAMRRANNTIIKARIRARDGEWYYDEHGNVQERGLEWINDPVKGWIKRW